MAEALQSGPKHSCRQVYLWQLLVLVTINTSSYGQWAEMVDENPGLSREIERDEQGRILALVLGSEGGDASLGQVGPLTHLRRFDASDSKMTDVGLEGLAGSAELTHLYLDNSKVTTAALMKSGLLGRLELLCVSGTAVTVEDRRRIRQEFPELAVFPLDADSLRSSDLLRLQGEWTAVSGERGGKPMGQEQLQDFAVTIREDMLKRRPNVLLIVSDPNDPNEKPRKIDVSDVELPFRLDPSSNPKHLDLEVGWSGIQKSTREGGTEKKGKPIYAKNIYALEKDRLRICWGFLERPTSFKTNENDGLVLLSYKRTNTIKGTQ